MKTRAKNEFDIAVPCHADTLLRIANGGEL
jgi:hypothetical protein